MLPVFQEEPKVQSAADTAEKLSGKSILTRWDSGEPRIGVTEGIILSGKKDRGTYRTKRLIGPSVFYLVT